jgi:hypothetical protein
MWVFESIKYLENVLLKLEVVKVDLQEKTPEITANETAKILSV